MDDMERIPLEVNDVKRMRDNEEEVEFQRKHTDAMMVYGGWVLESDAERVRFTALERTT